MACDKIASCWERQELFSSLVAGNRVWYQHQIGPQCSVNCQSTGTGMRCSFRRVEKTSLHIL
ncbi:hypothetical protein PRUPE_3G110700 [Prunus persica]|uniref:Uncharacterized protein n=1 Tax=Prunus persica TaxID=3760 RepID=A0A251PYG3_PRUPE|nr:hypothetical protein PRUPE_3G110700 [Prunus persica]